MTTDDIDTALRSAPESVLRAVVDPEMQYGDTRLPAKFWGSVYPEPNTGCWLWCGSITGRYGRTMVRGRAERPHRVTYDIATGAAPPTLDHRCSTPLCVNPAHLRPANASQNAAYRRVVCGRSRFKGVGLNKGRWRARVRHHGRRYTIGYFDTEEEAAAAYDKAAGELHGEFALTNSDIGVLRLRESMGGK